MAYIKRDEHQNIIAVYDSPQPDAQEKLPIDSSELLDYLRESASHDDARVLLSSSDASLIRVIEDLINTLIDKKVILFTDLPPAAQEKLANREKIRGQLNSLEDLMGDDQGNLSLC